ncbi:CrcB family protein [Streptomyces sp. NPDC051940]|uniref:fluoride efflux transporter FluC n=1 Tax=Streptomyces sp. NPDC051940 TaxID=3155675 RepID=UPI0034486124
MEPVDPDVDLHLPAHRAETVGSGLWKVLAAVSAGGVLGALARYGATELWPARWAVLGVNVVGCALIGVLMVLVSEMGSAHPLVRPFLGTGVLGGFTTFSAYAVDFAELLQEERVGAALGYASGTLVGALGAVWAAASVTRWAVARRSPSEAVGHR